MTGPMYILALKTHLNSLLWNLAATLIYPDYDDGLYHPSVKQPARIVIHSITFHEGFRPKGLKAVDVEVIARSQVNGENELVGGRDEIVSITGTSGKVYNIIPSNGTGVENNLTYQNFSEQRILQYADVDEKEENIVSVKLRRDGKIMDILR